MGEEAGESLGWPPLHLREEGGDGVVVAFGQDRDGASLAQRRDLSEAEPRQDRDVRGRWAEPHVVDEAQAAEDAAVALVGIAEVGVDERAVEGLGGLDVAERGRARARHHHLDRRMVRPPRAGIRAEESLLVVDEEEPARRGHGDVWMARAWSAR